MFRYKLAGMPMLNPVLDLTKLTLEKLGISISRWPPLFSFERELRNYLVGQQINCVIDVGAFKGQYAQFLRKLGYSGQIISFEPVASSFAELSKVMSGGPPLERGAIRPE